MDAPEEKEDRGLEKEMDATKEKEEKVWKRKWMYLRKRKRGG